MAQVGPSGRRVVNDDLPSTVPSRPMGEVPVIVRLEWADGTQEWRAARANRWTSTHVFVCWRDEVRDPRSERWVWLRAQDVARAITWLVPPERP